MSDLFLTDEDLYALTDYKRSAEQLRWLGENNYAHSIGASGRPKVLRAEMERHLVGGSGRASGRNARTPSLDLSAISAEAVA